MRLGMASPSGSRVAGKYPIPDRACPRITPPPPLARQRSQRAGERRYPSSTQRRSPVLGPRSVRTYGAWGGPRLDASHNLGGRAGCRGLSANNAGFPVPPSRDRCGHPTLTYPPPIISSLTTLARCKSVSCRETDIPGWGNRGCPAYCRGLARGGQAEVLGPVVEGRSTVRHAVYRRASQCMHRRRSPEPPHP
jgi:hypothetical protein